MMERLATSFTSNITIPSNIFVRQQSDLHQDAAFVHNCFGRPALTTLKERLHGTELPLKLTPAQEEELEQGAICVQALDGQTTHGLVEVLGQLVWVCRCEFVSCPDYASCMPEPLQRPEALGLVMESTSAQGADYQWLGSQVALEELFGAGSAADTNLPPADNLLLQVSEDALFTLSDNLDALTAESCLLSGNLQELPSRQLGRLDFAALPQTGVTAIIAPTAGLAEWVSHELHRKKVAHSLLRSDAHSPRYKPWLASVLWDFAERVLTKEDLALRYRYRVYDDLEVAELLAEELQDALGLSPQQGLALWELGTQMIGQQPLSPSLTTNAEDSLVVTALPEALGRQFTKVYLVATALRNSSKAAPGWLWLQGRALPLPGLEALSLRQVVLRQGSSGRWLREGKARWTRNNYAEAISIGQPGDLDPVGFVSGSLAEALAKQEYIANWVNVGDTVEVRLLAHSYQIFHQGTLIGQLSAAATTDIISTVSELYPRSSIPKLMTDLYISNIVTLVSLKSAHDLHPIFAPPGFWLGVELTGFGKVDWSIRG